MTKHRRITDTPESIAQCPDPDARALRTLALELQTRDDATGTDPDPYDVW